MFKGSVILLPTRYPGFLLSFSIQVLLLYVRMIFFNYRSCLYVVQVFFLLVMLSVTSVKAESTDTTTTAHRLSQSSRWVNMLHYYPSDHLFGADSENWESKVLDDDYFLSPEGKYNREMEWVASTKAFQLPASAYSTPENPHAQCRFPARFKLVKTLLSDNDISLRFPDVECPGYQQWRKKVNGQRATLVFASSYLNSPSSMFGHTFLRFDAEDVSDNSEWLSYALNFGAAAEKGDNSMLYAYKGLVGGYSGYFAMMPYYQKIKEYSKMENRSLWEYPLNLSPEEVNVLLAHVWELRDIAFTYFFFDENCSYRLLELIEVAKPGVELTESFRAHAIPIDTVRMLDTNGLLSKSVYRASASEKLLFNAQRLSKHEIKRVKALAEGRLSPKDVNSLLILNVAYQYLQLTSAKKQRSPALAKRQFGLLKAINKRSKTQTNYSPEKPPRPSAPQNSHRSQMAAFRTGSFENNAFVDIEFRASYHDLLDPINGYLKGGSINMGRVVFRQYENSTLDLHHIDFIDINSLSPQNELHQPTTWRVNAGVERIYSEDNDWLTLQLNGGAGVSFEPFNDLLIYSLMEARTEYALDGTSRVDAGLGVRGGIMAYSRIGTAAIELSTMAYSRGSTRVKLTAAQNIDLGKNSSTRISYQYSKNQLSGQSNDKRSGGFIEYRYHF